MNELTQLEQGFGNVLDDCTKGLSLTEINAAAATIVTA